ncbi:protein S100-G-like [Bufo gargarizans]|uniref:protein S100-G-like n=1 Tax=Bufo gargarizans TaxID=30331 RepID=UPI001CF22509|nr:protein S100-G-like [Bufo gargarizans]
MALQSVMVTLMKTFDSYAKGDGDSGTLSKSELISLVQKEFPALCESQNKDEILKGIFGQMDMDGDNKVNFKEFIIFLACLTISLKESL